jgi:hypothetical protein
MELKEIQAASELLQNKLQALEPKLIIAKKIVLTEVETKELLRGRANCIIIYPVLVGNEIELILVNGEDGDPKGPGGDPAPVILPKKTQ